MSTVLIVDDEKSIRNTLSELLRREGYDVQTAEDAKSGIALMERYVFDVVITDIILPRVMGVELLQQIRERAPEVPVIMMTGEPTVDTAVQAVRAGANDYLTKPIGKENLLKAVGHAARLKTLLDEKRRLEEDNRRYQDNLERLVEERTQALRKSEGKYRSIVENTIDMIYTADQTGVLTYVSPQVSILGYSPEEVLGRNLLEFIHPEDAKRVTREFERTIRTGEEFPTLARAVKKDGGALHVEEIGRAIREGDRVVGVTGVIRDVTEREEAAQRLQRTLDGTIEALALATEMRDPYTAGHERRVTDLACAIGREMGFSQARLAGLRVAGLLHDVGKISVPAEILSKPTTLTPAEFALVMSHPQSGHTLLKGIDFPWPVAEIVLEHHERLDGSGYPRGLKGEAILLEARILAVADVVEAMASHRPYRPALGIERALEEITQNRGIRYEPAAVDACAQLLAERRFAFSD